jgi:hypothetical protein
MNKVVPISLIVLSAERHCSGAPSYSLCFIALYNVPFAPDFKSKLDNFTIKHTISNHTTFSTISNMANNQLIQAPSGITKTNSLVSFTLFPKLPVELRIKIWGFSFVPHRVIMVGAGGRPQRSQITGSHLLVNFEARQVFLENYTRCLHNLGQKAVYFNFSIDTLCVKSVLRDLQELVK